MSPDEAVAVLEVWLTEPASAELVAVRADLTAAHPDLFRPPERYTPDFFLRRGLEDLARRDQLPAAVAPHDLPAACRPGGWLAERAARIAGVYDQVRLHQSSLQPGREWTPCARASWHFLYGRYRGDDARIRDVLADAFARALHGAGTFDPRYPFGPWFRRILETAASEERADAAEYGRMGELTGESAATAPREQRGSSWTGQELLDEITRAGVEVTPELLRLAAEESLAGRGVSSPTESQIAREARLLGEQWATRAGATPDPERVGGRLSELYAGYGHHRDFVRSLPAGDGRAVLDALTPLIEELLARQERAEAKQTPPAGSVPILADLQTRGWALAGSADERVRGAVRNLLWLSWRWGGLAVLAACRRYAERVGRPPLRPFVQALDAGTWLNNIPPASRAALAAHLPAVCPNGRPWDDEAGVMLAVTACVVAERTVGGRAVSRRRVTELTADLPDRDFNWWVSRVTGRGREQADADTGGLLARLAAPQPAGGIA